MADHVAQRRREIGLCIALGARATDVFRAVLGGTLAVVALGGVAGLAAAVGILSLTAVVAGYLPARRAARVDPLAALRAD